MSRLLQTSPHVAARRPLHRNPWLWAFLAGVMMLTAIRPLLRRIPDPPPVTGTIPDFALRDGQGRLAGPSALEGRVHIAAALEAECLGACAELLSGLGRIVSAYRERRIEGIAVLALIEAGADAAPVEQVAALLGGPGRGRDWEPNDGVLVLTGSRDELAPLSRAVFGEGPDRRPLAIIDARGRLRGRYGSDPLGLDEVYNRAQHVSTINP